MTTFCIAATKHDSPYIDENLSLFFETSSPTSEDLVILLDNDHSFSSAKAGPHKRLEVLKSPKSGSWVAGINAVIKKARPRGGDLVVLSGAVRTTPRWLGPITLEEEMMVGALTNHEVQYESEECATPAILDYASLKGKEEALAGIIGAHQFKSTGYASVPSLTPCAFKIPAIGLERCGELDSEFDAYGAVVDYSLRSQLAGIDVKFALASYVVVYGAPGACESTSKEKLERKWGSLLTQVCLAPPDSAVGLSGKAASLYTQRSFKNLVKEIKPNPCPKILLP